MSEEDLLLAYLRSSGWLETEPGWFCEPRISPTEGTVVRLLPDAIRIYRRFTREIVGDFTVGQAIGEIRGLPPFFGTGPGQDPCDYCDIPEATESADP